MTQTRCLDIATTPQEMFTRWDITGHQMNRRLLSEALTDTPDIVLDHISFPVGFVHHMHRHPHADMVIIPVAGSVHFDGIDEQSSDVGVGQILVIPRGQWHQISNRTGEEAEVLHFFCGVGCLDAIGYEEYAPAEKARD